MKSKSILPLVSCAFLLLAGCGDKDSREAFTGDWEGNYAKVSDQYDTSENIVLSITTDAMHDDMVTVSASVRGVSKVLPSNTNPLVKDDISLDRDLERPLYVNENRLTKDSEGRSVIFEYDEDTNSLKGVSEWWEMGVYEGNIYTKDQ